MAFADFYTGKAQPLEAPVGECGVPAADIREGIAAVQLISQFNYWACREYRSSKTKDVYYRIESVSDGEYTHLIPGAGNSAIDLMDYRYSVARVYQNCLRIRAMVIAQALPISSSKCIGL